MDKQNVANKVLKEVGVKDMRIVGITNQQKITILWDGRTSKPVYNSIV
ncbi:hypothetical protein [Thermosipho atlanticus]|nr:hypothetical protein [Thermosipho atlanticus]